MARGREEIIRELNEIIRHVNFLKEILLSDDLEVEKPDESEKKAKEIVDWQLRVTYILYEMKIPTHTVGYQYVQEAIIMFIQDTKCLVGMQKNMYPKIAEKYETTPKKVEAGIKNLIKMAYERGCLDDMHKILGDFMPKKKPTIKEFISRIGDHIRLDSMY